VANLRIRSAADGAHDASAVTRHHPTDSHSVTAQLGHPIIPSASDALSCHHRLGLRAGQRKQYPATVRRFCGARSVPGPERRVLAEAKMIARGAELIWLTLVAAKIGRMNERRMLNERSRVVLITGAPGSGKSTLGTELASSLRIPFVARDDVRGGLFFTEGAWTSKPRRIPTSDEAVETLLRLVETNAGLGVSCIVEYVIRQGRPDDWARITAAADCVVLLTMCRDAMARFADREMNDALMNRRPVLDALGHAGVEAHTSDAILRMESVVDEMRTDFDVPMLQVRTDHGYTPSLDQIIDFVVSEQPT
jgi:predicted kinase